MGEQTQAGEHDRSGLGEGRQQLAGHVQVFSYMSGNGPSDPTSTYRYSSTVASALAATSSAASQLLGRGRIRTSNAATTATTASVRNNAPWLTVPVTGS